MAASDFQNADVTRALQGSEAVCKANLASMDYWGAYNLVKAVRRGVLIESAAGYITVLPAIAGATPRGMEKMLGLRDRQLENGADIYRLTRVPKLGQFVPRGYSTLVDGLELRDGLTQDSHGYRPGLGAWQVVLTEPVGVDLAASLGPDEPFEPGLHPNTRRLYGL